MKLFKYNQFIGEKPLNENLDKAKKFLKNRAIINIAAKELGINKGEAFDMIGSGEKRTLSLKDFTPEQQDALKLKIREIRLTDNQVRDIERDADFVKLRELFKDNLGYLYNFVYMYYVEMVSFDEIKSIYERILTYGPLLDKLPKKFDANFIDTNISNNSEVLVDGLDVLEEHRKVKKIVDKLTPELKKDYIDSPEMVKDEFAQLASAFNELGKNDDGTIDEAQREKLWKSFFGEVKEIEGKKRYIGQLKRYKSIREFIKAAQNYLKASQNSDILAFYDKVNKCNEKYGYLGADIVFDGNGILILEVKSFQANQILNGHTRHCIKDYMSQWDNYVASRNNKQYYIYNFNIPQYDNKSVIGITIGPGASIYACHQKDDGGCSGSIKAWLKAWEKEYGIDVDLFRESLKSMTPEEIDKRERAKIAEREIIKKGLTIEQIINYVKVDGANINKDNAKALENAVIENDLEKTKVCLELGASPNLKPKGTDSIISKAKGIDMIKLLVSNGAELTGEVFGVVLGDLDSLEYCLKAGLDPNFGSSLAYRKVCKGTWENKNKIGEGLFDAFKLLVKYTKDLNPRVVKWSSEYARVDFIEYLVGLGLDKKFSDDDYEEAITWVKHARKVPEADQNRTIDYIQTLMKKK